MAENDLQNIVGRVLREAPFAMRQLAADSGLSYDVLRSWRSGRRRPSRASVQRLADGLERRSEQLRDLARELRGATESRETRSAAEPRSPAEPRDERESGTAPEPGSPRPSYPPGEVGRAADRNERPDTAGVREPRDRGQRELGGAFGPRLLRGGADSD